MPSTNVKLLVLVVLALPVACGKPVAAAEAVVEEKAAAPCCIACASPRAKYYSVDAHRGHCGEACILPALYPLFKVFEPNLTAAVSRDAKACAKQFSPDGRNYTAYNGTVTHGVPGLSVTLDLYSPA